MKKTLLLVGVVFLALSFVFPVWGTRSSTLRCKHCLHSRYVSEKQFGGITFWRSTTDRSLGEEERYQRVFGRACSHGFHKDGVCHSSLSLFGGQIFSCGRYAESALFQARDMALAAAFDAEERITDRELALASFHLIDRLVPVGTTFDREATLSPNANQTLELFAAHLKRANNAQEWKQCLDDAERDFADLPPLPKS